MDSADYSWSYVFGFDKLPEKIGKEMEQEQELKEYFDQEMGK